MPPPRSHLKCAFLGTVIASFERSTLAEHAGTRTVVLRIHHVFDLAAHPVVPEMETRPPCVPPMPGELWTPPRVQVRGPWAVNVDKPGGEPFRTLFENEASV